MEEPPAAVPPALSAFLSAQGGRSLIIRGMSGTGKTTLALQLMEHAGRLPQTFYVSTRVSDSALYRHFPWLEAKEWRERLLDCSRELLRSLSPRGSRALPQAHEGRSEVVHASRRFLSHVYDGDISASGTLDRTQLQRLSAAYDVEDLSVLYDRIAAVLPAKPLVVIDSLEGLAEQLDLSMVKLVQVLQKDLVEHSGIDLVLVLETDRSVDLDYLVDGVAQLRRTEIDGRRIRQLETLKLRGVEVGHPLALFSLSGGRFRHFPRYGGEEVQPLAKRGAPPWNGVEENSGFYSSGNRSLDSVLGGGFPIGGNVLLELMDNVPQEVYEGLLYGLVASFITRGRGVMVVPFNTNSPEDFGAMATGAGGAGTELLRVAVKQALDKPPTEPYIFTLGYEDITKDYERWLRERAKLRERTGKGILELIALETQEARFGEESYKGPLSISSEQARVEGDLIVRLSKPGLDLVTQRAANASSIHLKLRRLHGAVVLYGERPQTEMFVLQQGRFGAFDAHLVPML